MDVLIVDDEIDICYLLTAILRKKDLTSKYVNTLKDAELILQSDNPSIIFLDNNLPDGYGIGFIQNIKRKNSSIKIILITANDTVEDRDKAFNAGADFFIGKPFSFAVINNIITKFTEEKVYNTQIGN